jgi:signal transduction histidine kinase
MQKGTLLIVDDVPANLSVLSEFLSEAGFKVLVTQDGNRAIKKAESVHPNLVLLDVMMPNMDGFEVCRILKSNDCTKDIPVIFMTALADTIDKIKGFSLGAADYITKPIQHEEVLARINTHLNLRRLQQESQSYTVELEKRNQELEAFSRTVAHDLKNPLNLVINYTESVLEDYPPGTPVGTDAVQQLQTVLQVGRKMVTIVDALLLLAGVSKQREMKLQPLAMSVILSQVIQQRLGHLIKESHGQVKLPESWPLAYGYAPWVEEVWANYLSNALKYGGQPPNVELGASSQTPGMIRFWVRDNGQGLSTEAQKQLFTPFTRLHQDRAEGHGLGLSIVRQVIEKLGGQVGVESVLGQGSTFYFTLPATGVEEKKVVQNVEVEEVEGGNVPEARR